MRENIVSRIRYEPARDVESLARDIVSKLGMNWIRLDNVGFIRSYGSRSSAVARIYGLPRVFQSAFGLEPLYVIEVISEKYDSLQFERKVEVLIHELLHIPSNFSGGLRPHGRIVNGARVKKLARIYFMKKGS
ncbi:hypothetical protein MA03_01310 [Infirmifilum uzonense]|uniref:Putative phage metallopeptidase domain-containing protein n=1 Tax=Infirmifilum uzonense TaxID=1550241 RepID=A0A0F7FGK0_9CREN|nr:hypothetical protein MA03_01310 [Infirmifilum uzonense]